MSETRKIEASTLQFPQPNSPPKLPENEDDTEYTTASVEAPADLHTPSLHSIVEGSSGIHSLPPEVLLQIFFHLGDLEYEPYTFLKPYEEADMSMTMLPSSVSNVCTYWDSVAAMDPVFWGCDVVVINLMEPNPACRLQKRLFRMAQNLRDIRLRIWSALPTVSTVNPHLIEKAKLVEWRRMTSVVPIIVQYADRFRTLNITSILASSLPTLAEVLPEYWSVDRHQDLLKVCIRSVSTETDNFHPPRVAPSSSAADYHAIPNYRPELLTEPIPTQPYMHSLNFSGPAFVSFCRALLSTENAAAVIHRRGRKLDLNIFLVEPGSGGATPFVLGEFLSAMRLLCGTLENLCLKDVNLPIPPATPGAIRHDNCNGFRWPRCNPVDHETAPRPLGRVGMERVGMPVKVGIREIILTHYRPKRGRREWGESTLYWQGFDESWESMDVDWNEVVTGTYTNEIPAHLPRWTFRRTCLNLG